MSATLTPQDIKHIAGLARFDLTPAEVAKFSEQLPHVLDYFEKISQVKTARVETKGQVTVEENRFRDDVVDRTRMLSQQEALGQAKRTHKGFFVVEAVLPQP